MIPALEIIGLPDITEDYKDDFPEEIWQELNASKQPLRCFAIYTLALHSNIVHRRKMCSFAALGSPSTRLQARDPSLIRMTWPL